MAFYSNRTTTLFKWLPGLILVGALSACGGSDNDDDDENQASGPTASTAQGTVEGVEEDTMLAFKGIPYAAPPVGDLRWQPPEPPADRGEILQANEFGGSCIQPASTFGAAESTEDCLYLNVYRPKAEGNYPVMVWIHGGSLETGSGGGSYDPTRLVGEDMVVVTINYRLGILGFLAHPELTTEGNGASGNYGIMDQRAALEWVQSNIASFGGDPNNVTIFGESAGGHSVLTHLVSPASEGLFHKVIVQSGSYQPTQRTLGTAESWGSGIATDLGCDTADDVLQCLRDTPAEDFIAAQDANDYSFYPNTRQDTYPNTIADGVASGQIAQVPVMLGSNMDEYRLFVALAELSGGDLTDNESTFRSQISGLTGIPTGSATMDGIVSAYPWNTAAYDNDVSLAFSAVGTDAVFACNSLDHARSLSSYVPTYKYEFSDRDAPSIIGDPTNYSFDLGAAHAFEIQYVFGGSEAVLSAIGMDADQVSLANTMVKYWSRFAKFGNPNGSGEPPFWPSFSAGSGEIMELAPAAVGTQTESNFNTVHRCDSVWLAD
ncbi:carboxylesterase family protein [Ectothiorhodospiraceae bacterium WFHF3C12]|nr:carboxylesterase family protein [Ectothiorhodospiraceae bacterium WFHF3C12]